MNNLRLVLIGIISVALIVVSFYKVYNSSCSPSNEIRLVETVDGCKVYRIKTLDAQCRQDDFYMTTCEGSVERKECSDTPVRHCKLRKNETRKIK